MSLREAVNRLRGAVGSEVVLRVRRAGAAQPIELTAKREIIRQQSVRLSWTEGDVLEVRVSRLFERTRAELQREIARLASERGREPRGVVLDLRGNSGGLLTAAVDLSGVFLEDGVPVGSTRGRGGRQLEAYRANDPKLASRFGSSAAPLPAALSQALKKVPVVVLVAKRTASGAEILAAALQANGRALLAGERTFGMGSIQTLFPLGAAGGGASLKLTTSYWFGPKDGELDGRPLEPDLPASEALAPEEARRWLAGAGKGS
jgi:carboxyl-terminal processing protease